MNRAIVIHPVLLYNDFTHFVDLGPALERALRTTELFFEQFGIYVYLASPKTPRLDHTIDLAAANPWQQVYDQVVRPNLLGADPGHFLLTFLRGWADPYYMGWGGAQLAVMGDWAIDKFLSLGSPEAVWDDNYATAVLCHEIGHTFGLGHAFDDPNNIMAYQWRYFPNLFLTADQRAQIHSRLEAMSAGAAFDPEGCALHHDEEAG